MKDLFPGFLALLFAGLTTASHAQPLVGVDTVLIGNSGNSAHWTGKGSVGYDYRMGKYEVTIGQYPMFLNSVASVTSDSFMVNLWNPVMATDMNIAGVSRSGSGTIADPYSYSVIGSGNRPIAYVSWFDAARFANWINNGATVGASTETGAYTLNGATAGNAPGRNVGATWWIPTADEWYKAAYYSPGGGYSIYPTQSSDTSLGPGNIVGGSVNQANFRKINKFSVTQSAIFSAEQNYLTDVGAFSNSASAYGTFDQGGNLEEWNSLSGEGGSSQGIHGGDWDNNSIRMQSDLLFGSYNPTLERDTTGFRVATVPEPSTYALLFFSALGFLFWNHRQKAR